MSRDPFEGLFESLDRTRDLDDAQIDLMIPTANLLSQIDGASIPAVMKKRRFWRRGLVLSTVAILVAGSAAAAITLSRGPVETVAHMTCYRSDSLRSTADVISYQANPLAECSQVMHWTATANQGAHGEGSLCLLADGSLSAFPPSHRMGLCSYLHLAEFNGELAHPEFSKFQSVAEMYFARHRCQSVNTAHQQVLQLMGAYGLASWSVRVMDSISPKACATLAFQLKSKVVDIVGADRPHP